jgi:hypothetical protein
MGARARHRGACRAVPAAQGASVEHLFEAFRRPFAAPSFTTALFVFPDLCSIGNQNQNQI